MTLSVEDMKEEVIDLSNVLGGGQMMHQCPTIMITSLFFISGESNS